VPLTLTAPPAGNPFAALPFPAPGDRIKADDFKQLSQALRILFDAYTLANALFGRTLGEARLALMTQQYEIARVISVYGAELSSSGDASLDSRKVLQVMPVVLGERRVTVVVSEAADTRRFMPNLVGLTYRQAMQALQTQLGDVLARGGSITVPQFVGQTLAQAELSLSRNSNTT
jgi:hypothetical protein